VTPCGVRFRKAGRIYYFDTPAEMELQLGDRVVVETTRGIELGTVVISPGQVVEARIGELRPVLRRASGTELSNLARYQTQEPQAVVTARQRIAAHGLPMKAVLAEYNFDGSRLTMGASCAARAG
jgi:cell fate regulator YaaT (PSP1 superfamily)